MSASELTCSGRGKHSGTNVHYWVPGPSALNEKSTCAVVGVGILSEISFLGKAWEPFAEAITALPELTKNNGFPVRKVRKTRAQKTTDRPIEGRRAWNPVVRIHTAARGPFRCKLVHSRSHVWDVPAHVSPFKCSTWACILAAFCCSAQVCILTAFHHSTWVCVSASFHRQFWDLHQVK